MLVPARTNTACLFGSFANDFEDFDVTSRVYPSWDIWWDFKKSFDPIQGPILFPFQFTSYLPCPTYLNCTRVSYE